ncbi:MAG: TonB-dependent receptor, partial [Steroidobacteraceae bacterium]
APNPAKGLEEIIVTAQKKEERLSETPVSITALSGETLERLGATQFRDFAPGIPGLSFTTGGVGQTQINLRGVSTGSNISPTVGIYVDEVPYGSSTAFAASASLALDVGLFDVDRVEILRGPQGTLYGASTMGGLLKYVSVMPDTKNFSGTARAGLSNTSHGGVSYDMASAVNLPVLDDKAALRLSGFYSHDGGYIDNRELGQEDVNQAYVYGGRGDFLWQASDRFSVRIALYAQNISRDGSNAADFNLATGKPIAGDLDQFVALPEPFDQQYRLASATVKYKFDFAELTAVSSYQTVDVGSFLDATDFYVPLLSPLLNAFFGIDTLNTTGVDYGFTTDKFAQELRLASEGERFDWLVGAFYTYENSNNKQAVDAYLVDGTPLPINLGFVRIPSDYEEIAGFGALTWHVTSTLDLEGGLRYAHNSQTTEQIGGGLLLGSNPKRDTSEDPVTYLAGLRYLPNENLRAYLRIATGYRPGGPNVVANDPATGLPLADPTFDSDSLTSYEAGVKMSSAGQRYSVDAAIYQIDWDDLQINVVRNGIGVAGNAGTARSRGAELTLTARPVDPLTLVGAFGYTDAKLTEDSPDLGAQNGDPLPGTPEYTVALAADYAFTLGGHGASAGASWRYIDDRVSGYRSGGYPQYDLPSYDVIDLRAGVDFGDAAVQIYVKNLADERGQLNASTAMTLAGGPANVSIMQPRTVGITLSCKF